MRIDLHCHSSTSDGSLNIWDLLKLSKTVGLDGLVLTDHCSPHDSFHTNRVIAKTLKEMGFDIPVIIGSEIMTPYGEFLLFGKKACKQWNEHKHSLAEINKHFGATAYWDMFNKYVLHKVRYRKSFSLFDANIIQPLGYGLIMCHPRNLSVRWCNDMPDSFWGLLHGFEIQNGYEDYSKLIPDVVEWLQGKINKCKCVRNSDCHDDELGSVFNDIPLKEFSEDHLIHWLRS